MDAEVTLFSKPEELIAWADTFDILLNPSIEDAAILLNYMEGHDYAIGIDSDGKMYRQDVAEENGEIEPYSIDDVIDTVCEWNYELILDADAHRNDPRDFKDYSEYQDKYDSLKADEKRLDRLFEKTCYAKEIDEMAAALVESFISHLSSRDEEVIRELLDLLKKNAMKEQANDVFEICSYVDGLEKKIDSMTEELTNMQNQIKEMQEDTLVNNAKKALSEAQERLNARCEQIKSQVLEVKAQVKSTAKSIVDEAKAKGRAALYRLSEFLGIKKRLLDIRENVRGAIKTTDKDIAKTTLLAKGFREAGQTAANAFRTFADKPEVDYSQKEQKHPITKAVLAPMKAVKKMLVSMELHLDASIDKLDNLAMNVKLYKEKGMENMKKQEQTEPERAEAERVEAEVVYSPMVAEPQEYQYNADAFEARGADEVKQEAAHEEAPKVRGDKAR